MRIHAEPPQSICILRLSSLGDATHVVPVIRSLQAHWPGTRITWVIGALEHRLLRGLEGIEFIVFDKRGGWQAVRQFSNALSGRRFDLLLHMQVAARANLLSRFIRAPVRLGWDRMRSRDFHRFFTNASVASVPFQHQVEAFLEFPRALGLNVEQPRWELPVSEEAQVWTRERLDPGRSNLVISPCSSHALRNWQAAHYATVADFASAELGMQVILSGGPGEMERDVSTTIQGLMNEPCINLVGQDTLETSMALLGQADLVISPDSGPAHIASALGTDVLGLYAATWSRRSGPYRSLDLCVDRFTEAARRYCHSEPEELRWGTRIERTGVMDLIEPADVIKKLQAWWEQQGGRRRGQTSLV